MKQCKDQCDCPLGLVDSNLVVVSAADSVFFDLVHELFESLQQQAPGLPFAVFDLGLTEEQKSFLGGRGVMLLKPKLHFGLGEAFDDPLSLSLMVRPFLPTYLPGYRFYAWLDSDLWLQDSNVLNRLVEGAASKGMAAIHEDESSYRFQFWLWGWTLKHAALGFGPLSAMRQRFLPQINAGVFCIERDAPHWQLWQKRFEQAIRRTGQVAPYDQFAVNAMACDDRAPIALLEPEDNWICDRALPAWDRQRGIYVTPTEPHRPIAVVHLAGPAKASTFDVPVIGGGSMRRWLTYSGLPALGRPLAGAISA